MLFLLPFVLESIVASTLNGGTLGGDVSFNIKLPKDSANAQNDIWLQDVNTWYLSYEPINRPCDSYYPICSYALFMINKNSHVRHSISTDLDEREKLSFGLTNLISRKQTLKFID